MKVNLKFGNVVYLDAATKYGLWRGRRGVFSFVWHVPHLSNFGPEMGRERGRDGAGDGRRWRIFPPYFQVGCFGSVHVNQLTDWGLKNQKNQSKLILLIPLYFMQDLKYFSDRECLHTCPKGPGCPSLVHFPIIIAYLCLRSEKVKSRPRQQKYGKWWPYILYSHL